MNKMKKFLIIALSLIFLTNSYSQDKIDVNIKPESLPAKNFTFPEHKEYVLKNGLKLFIIEDHEQPIISLRMQIAGGKSMDRDNPGVAEMTADMLLKGYGKTSAQQIAAKLDGVGASISANAGIDAITISSHSLKKHFPLLMDILKNAVINPSFPKGEFEKLIPQYQANLQQRKGTPGALAADLSKIVLYGENHPYSSRMTNSSLEKIKVDDLKYYHNTFFKPSNATLAIVGDVDPEEIVEQMNKYLGEWKSEKPPEVQIPPAKPHPTGVYFVSRPGSVQSTIFLCTPGLAYIDKDYQKLALAADVIGAGFAGRLFRTLRETHSYTYSPYGMETANKFSNYFFCVADVRNSVADSAITVIKEQLNLLATQEASNEELMRVKKSVVGTYLMRFEDSDFIASLIQRAYFYGVPMHELKRYPELVMGTTPYEIRAVANKYMNPFSAFIVVVGAPEVRDKLSVFGNVYDYNLDLEPLTGAGAKLEKSKLDAKELIEKYTQAIGGKAAIEATQTLKITGTIDFASQGKSNIGEITSKYKQPNKMYRIVKFPFRTQETISDGVNVWTKDMEKYNKYSGNDSTKALLDATLFKETQLLQLGYKCSVLGSQGDYILMKAVAPYGTETTYYFNSKTFFLEKAEYLDEDQILVTEKISDYTEVGDLLLPTLRQTTTQMFTVTNKLSYELNPVIEDWEFRVE